MTSLLITGATGYIGSALTQYALTQNADVLTLLRRKPEKDFSAKFLVPSDWENIQLLAKTMEGRDAVIHCAGLAHNKQGDMWQTNLDLTAHLAQAARLAGVKRFVFISSAAVYGESGVYTINDEPFPTSEYGHSKFEAENEITVILSDSSTKLTIIRPPMVIGRNAPGHAASLRKLARTRLPLPFGALQVERAYIQIDNLVRVVFEEALNQEGSCLVHATDPALPVHSLIHLMLAQNDMKPVMLPVPAFIFRALQIIPSMRPKLESLLQSHILVAGRKSLDRVV